MDQQEPSQATQGMQGMQGRRFPANWNTVVCTLCAVLSVAYSVFITPAAAAYRGNQDTIQQLQVAIQQLLERQKQQDARQDKLEARVDRQGEMLSSIDKQTAMSAKTLEWMSSWIKAGGQK